MKSNLSVECFKANLWKLNWSVFAVILKVTLSRSVRFVAYVNAMNKSFVGCW